MIIAEILNDFSDSKFSLILLSEKDYFNKLVQIVKSANKEGYKICYVILTNSCKQLVQGLKNKLDLSNFFFINSFLKDCSKEDKDNCESRNNCITIPPEIETIEEQLKKYVEKNPQTVIIFDTVSALLVYEHTSTIVKMTNLLVSHQKFENTNKLYLVLKDFNIKIKDHDNLLKDLRMFAQKEINLD